MTPDQEERKVLAWERIAGALERIAAVEEKTRILVKATPREALVTRILSDEERLRAEAGKIEELEDGEREERWEPGPRERGIEKA